MLPQAVEDVVRVVGGDALAVERPGNSFERIPEQEHPRVGQRLGQRVARGAGDAVERVRPGALAGAPDLLDRRESAARGVELAVPASGKNGPDVDVVAVLVVPEEPVGGHRVSGDEHLRLRGSSCARRPPGARPGPSPRGSARPAHRGTGRDPSAIRARPRSSAPTAGRHTSSRARTGKDRRSGSRRSPAGSRSGSASWRTRSGSGGPCSRRRPATTSVRRCSPTSSVARRTPNPRARSGSRTGTGRASRSPRRAAHWS